MKAASSGPAFLFDLDGTLVDTVSACARLAGSFGGMWHWALCVENSSPRGHERRSSH